MFTTIVDSLIKEKKETDLVTDIHILNVKSRVKQMGNESLKKSLGEKLSKVKGVHEGNLEQYMNDNSVPNRFVLAWEYATHNVNDVILQKWIMRRICEELLEGKNVTEDNRINVRLAAKKLQDPGTREEINTLLMPLKGEFEMKVDELLADVNNSERFNESWDTVNLLTDRKKQPNLVKLLLLRIVNETHSGINVTKRNKDDLKKRINVVQDKNLRAALMQRLKSAEEVQMFAPSPDLKKSFRGKKLDMATPKSSLYDEEDIRSEITKTPSCAEGFLVETGQRDPIKMFDMGFPNGKYAKVVRWRFDYKETIAQQSYTPKVVANKSISGINSFDRGRNCILITGARPKKDEWTECIFKGLVRAAASTDAVFLTNGLKLLPPSIPKNVHAVGIAAESQVKITIVNEKSDQLFAKENSKGSWGTLASPDLSTPHCLLQLMPVKTWSATEEFKMSVMERINCGRRVKSRQTLGAQPSMTGRNVCVYFGMEDNTVELKECVRRGIPIVVPAKYSENSVLLEDVWNKEGVENKFSFVKNPAYKANVFFLPSDVQTEAVASLMHYLLTVSLVSECPRTDINWTDGRGSKSKDTSWVDEEDGTFITNK